MDEEFYKRYDQTYGTHYSSDAAESKPKEEPVPAYILACAQEMETLLNDSDYGSPWKLLPQKPDQEEAGHQTYVCILANRTTGARFEIRLDPADPTQGLEDWIESRYNRLRRLYHGLQDWKKKSTDRKVEEFEQLPDEVKRRILQEYSSKE